MKDKQTKQGKQDDRPILTTRQGHPVSDNQ